MFHFLKGARLVGSQLWLKQKGAVCSGKAKKQEVTIQHFLPNKKTEKVSIVFEEKKKTEHGNDSKDTRKIMSAVINQSGNHSI